MTQSPSDSIFIAKKAAGEAAAQLIKEGMVVGLGTGSTAAFFIEALGKRCQAGLKISAIATSEQSTRHAKRLRIPLEKLDTALSPNITVDGADEIDHEKNMIKGGGGALLREKLLAEASQEMMVIIDNTKLVDHLGQHPLPVEIAPFLYKSTLQRLEWHGYEGSLRRNSKGTPFITDNGNYIFDIQYSVPILDPQKEQAQLKRLTGVIETGLFFHLAKRVVVGYKDGSVTHS